MPQQLDPLTAELLKRAGSMSHNPEGDAKLFNNPRMPVKSTQRPPVAADDLLGYRQFIDREMMTPSYIEREDGAMGLPAYNKIPKRLPTLNDWIGPTDIQLPPDKVR